MRAAGVVAALALAAVAAAQTSFVPSRLWDGKTPDFRGIWQVRDTAFANIEGHPAAQGIAASKSIVIDPPDGKIPYNRAALANAARKHQRVHSAKHHCARADPPVGSDRWG